MLGGSGAGDEEGGEERTTVEVELDVDVAVEVEMEGMLVFGSEVAGSGAVAFSSTLASSVSCDIAGLLGFVLVPLSIPLASLAAGLLVHGE